jgi:hypothetical protein
MQIAFSRGVLIGLTVLLLLNMTLWLVGLIGIYIGDEYVTPALSEQSVPQPKLY